jgi:hypothetical protein
VSTSPAKAAAEAGALAETSQRDFAVAQRTDDHGRHLGVEDEDLPGEFDHLASGASALDVVAPNVEARKGKIKEPLGCPVLPHLASSLIEMTLGEDHLRDPRRKPEAHRPA